MVETPSTVAEENVEDESKNEEDDTNESEKESTPAAEMVEDEQKDETSEKEDNTEVKK